MLNKKFVLIVTEGETDELFYRKILEVLKTKVPNKRFSVDKIDSICINGFGKFESKFIAKYKKISHQYKKKNKNCEIYIFLCYDNDVFIGKKNPPIDWRKIEKNLYANGAASVHHIIANLAIEDFILHDFNGILRYLQLKNLKPAHYKGLDGLKKLYKKANKAYIKGTKCESLLNALDFNVIEKKICPQLSSFCKIIGVPCSKTKDEN